jgi:signal transduction histidine kinase
MSLEETRRAERMDVVAHDIRTPLTVISLRVQLLTQKIDRGQPIDPDKLRRSLGDIGEQVRLMQRALARAEGRSEEHSGWSDEILDQSQ